MAINNRPMETVRGTSKVLYDEAFFDTSGEESLRSARIIVPLLMNLLNPRSVIDVGCAVGSWLKAFAENGVEDYLGIDGDYVDRGKLLIDSQRFRAMDLAHLTPVGRTSDLAVCLEVGEHLPTRVSPRLVEMLVATAPAVLFSAAIPGQGGTQHVNEQWPFFWQRLFSRHNYVRLDPIRRHICFDSRVESYYRQNILLYVSQQSLEQSEKLQEEIKWADRVNVEILQMSVLAGFTSFSGLMKLLPGAAWRAIKNRFSVR
ncbi:MAG: class I SAM-dependent methyltransferase [Gemmataceae bacterium]